MKSTSEFGLNNTEFQKANRSKEKHLSQISLQNKGQILNAYQSSPSDPSVSNLLYLSGIIPNDGELCSKRMKVYWL